MSKVRDFFPLHFCSIYAIGVAHPLLERLSTNAEFFIIRNCNPADILVFVAILFFGIPGFLLLIVSLARLVHSGFSFSLRMILLFLTLSGTILVGLNRLLQLGSVNLMIALLLSALILWGYLRSALIRGCFHYLFPVILIVPLLFLLNPSIGKLIFRKQMTMERIKVQSTMPVVIVVFDEFPLISLLDQNYKIDRDMYPNFARLAEESSWYANATTVGDGTPTAVPSILTGKYPEKLQLPIIEDHPQNLFTLFGGSYQLNVTERITRLCPKDIYRAPESETFVIRMKGIFRDLAAVYLHIVVPSTWTNQLPPVGNAWGNFWNRGNPAGETTNVDRAQEFRQFIDSIGESNEPSLYYFHSLLPHDPWEFLPSGEKKYCRVSADPKSPLNNELRCHLLQVRFVDVLMGELIAKLKKTNLYDRSLIIIVADHGRSFDLHSSRRAVRRSNYSDQMLVPLFIKAPHQTKGSVNFRNVETIDILPTIADYLGVRIQWSDGSSLLNRDAPERRKKWLYSRISQALISFEPNMRIDPETMKMKIAIQQTVSSLD